MSNNERSEQRRNVLMTRICEDGILGIVGIVRIDGGD
jgi:hypothetical protein